jgi:hypothetical protein
MYGTKPIDRYGNAIACLQGLRKKFQDWSELSPMQHQMILWLGPGDPPTIEAWKEFLLEVGIFPYEASTPEERTEFRLLPDASRWNSLRWRDAPKIRGEYDILLESKELVLHVYSGLRTMLWVHEWCLLGSECKVPKWF